MEQIYVFGCGQYFKMKEKELLKKYNVMGIFDNFKEGSYTLNNGMEVPIILPNEETVKDKKIIIMLNDFLTVWDQLEKLGACMDDIIFSYEVNPLYGQEKKLFSDGERLETQDGKLYYVNQIEKVLIQRKEDMADIWKARERSKIDGRFISKECPTSPLNRTFGFSRGTPIDRYYIEKFLEENKGLIHGDVLEVADNMYTMKYGGKAVKKSHILHVNPENEEMLKGNFETGEGIVSNSMDCMILTQVLPFMYDVTAAVHNIYRMLKPEGAALITVTGISQISRYDMDRWGHYWGFTDLSMRRLLQSVAAEDKINIKTYGNVKSATALLYGMSVEEMQKADMDVWDKDYQVSICAVLRK